MSAANEQGSSVKFNLFGTQIPYKKKLISRTKWKLKDLHVNRESALLEFHKEVQAQARACGFTVAKKATTSFNFEGGGKLVLWHCSKKTLAYQNRDRINWNERPDPQRPRPRRPRAGKRQIKEEDCCKWVLQLRFFLQRGVVTLEHYETDTHNHTLMDFEHVPLALADLKPHQEERIKAMHSSGAMTATQIAKVMETEIELETGHPVTITKSAIDKLSGTERKEGSVAVALRAIVRLNRRHAIFAAAENGTQVTLTNVSDGEIEDAEPLAEKEEQAQRRENRERRTELGGGFLQSAAEGAVRNDQNLRTAKKLKRNVVKDAVRELEEEGAEAEAAEAAEAAPDAPPDARARLKRGKGNHGPASFTPEGWTRFKYDGKMLTMLAVVWVPCKAYEDALKYGRVIICDNGYCTNKYRFPLFNAVTQDNDNRTIQVMKGWVTNERFVTFDLLYSKAFKALFPADFLVRVRLLVVDGDGQQIAAIEAALLVVFVSAKLASCLVHLIQKPLGELKVKRDTPKAEVFKTIKALFWAAARNARTKEHFLAMLTIAEHAVSTVENEAEFVEGALSLVRSLRAAKHWANYEFLTDYWREKGRTGNPAEGMNNTDTQQSGINARYNLANAAAAVAGYSVSRRKQLDVLRSRAVHAASALSADPFAQAAPRTFTPYAVGRLSAAAVKGRGCEVLRVAQQPGAHDCTFVTVRRSQLEARPLPLYAPAIYDAAQNAFESCDSEHILAAQVILQTRFVPRHLLSTSRGLNSEILLQCTCRRFVRSGFLCWAQAAILLDIDPLMGARDGDAISMFHKDYSDPDRAFHGGVIFPGDFAQYAAGKAELSLDSSDKRSLDSLELAVEADAERRSPPRKVPRSRAPSSPPATDQTNEPDKAFVASVVRGVANGLSSHAIEEHPQYANLCARLLAVSKECEEAFDQCPRLNETSKKRGEEARDFNMS